MVGMFLVELLQQYQRSIHLDFSSDTNASVRGPLTGYKQIHTGTGNQSYGLYRWL